MPLSFNEETSLEQGFERVFLHEIAPGVEALQADRTGLRERTIRDLKLLAAVTAGLMLVVLVLHSLGLLPKGWLLVPPILAVGLGSWLIWRRQQAWAERLIEAVMPSFCRFLGDLDYRRRGTGADYVDPFEALGLVATANVRVLEHCIAGQYRDTRFDLVHAQLSRKSSGKNKTSSTVFQGLLFRIAVPARVPLAIVIMPRLAKLPGPLALLQRRANDDLPEIAVDQPAFAAKFVVRAELSGPADETAVRAFLTPGFMAALVAIDEAEAKRSYGLAGLSAGFAGQTFYLTLSRQHLSSIGPIKVERPKGFLETGWFLRRDLDLEAAIHGMFKDIGIAHRVIDHLHGKA
jgi:hypothetical protein